MFTFKQTQRFRIIVDNVCFYARAKEIRCGVGDFYKCNAAIQKALCALELTVQNQARGETHIGICGTWEGINVQLNMANT